MPSAGVGAAPDPPGPPGSAGVFCRPPPWPVSALTMEECAARSASVHRVAKAGLVTTLFTTVPTRLVMPLPIGPLSDR